MLNRTMLLTLAALLTSLNTASQVQAWGAAHVGYTHVGPSGVQHYGRTAAVGPYGNAYSGGHASAYGYGGGSYHAGYGAAASPYGGAAAGGYHYASSPYGGYSAGGFRAASYGGYGAGYSAGVYRRW